MKYIDKMQEIREKLEAIENGQKEEKAKLREILSEAEEDLESAEADIKRAEADLDLEAFKEASGEKWLAEKRVENARANLENSIKCDNEELGDIEKDLNEVANELRNEFDKHRNKLIDSINKKEEEFKAQDIELSRLYGVMNTLSGNIYGPTFNLHSLSKLEDARYALQDHNPFVSAVPVTIGANGMPIKETGTGRLAQPGY